MSMQINVKILYITTADHAEAEALARALLEARLVACANILPAVTSLYWWEGVIRQGRECLLVVKTGKNCVDAVINKVKSMHSYDCPCVVELPVEGGNPDFLRWIYAETSTPV